MRFRYFWNITGAFGGALVVAGGVALPSGARVHLFKSVQTIISSGITSAGVVYLLERGAAGAAVSGSELMLGYYELGPDPYRSGVVEHDLGDEGMPLPSRSVSNLLISSSKYPAANLFYMAPYYSAPSSGIGAVQGQVEWTYDFPYDLQDKIGPLWLT